jgi:hypothetical protein
VKEPASTTEPVANINPITRRPRGNQRGVLGPYSRIIDKGARGAINGRSREGRYLAAFEAQLLEHLGRPPSIVERALITRCARLSLHLELIDEQAFLESKGLTQCDINHYCAWSNALRRNLLALGIDAPKADAAPPPLREVIANAGGRR